MKNPKFCSVASGLMLCLIVIISLMFCHPVAAMQFTGGCEGDPDFDCTTPRNMADYWPSPPVGTFILINLVQIDGVGCAKKTRYRVANIENGQTSYVFDEFDCHTGKTVWNTTWYYEFDRSNRVMEWRDDMAVSPYRANFEEGKEIIWGYKYSMKPGVWVENQTKKRAGGRTTWGWSKTRLDGTYKQLTINGLTFKYAIRVTNVQSEPGGSDTNSGYILAPISGGGGYGGFIRQEYYGSGWDVAGIHQVIKTCITHDFNQLNCP